MLNIMSGLGSIAGEALVDHPLLHSVAFTGSTGSTHMVARCAPTAKRVTLELGTRP